MGSKGVDVDGMHLEAATIPLIILTAALSLFRRQGLPPPWERRAVGAEPMPLIVYGASSALGCFAIKLAKAAGVHPIIAVAGGSRAYAEGLLEGERGDRMVDYRDGVEVMMRGVRSALGGVRARHAIDCISAGGTWVPLTRLVEDGGVVSVVSGANGYEEGEIPRGVRVVYTYVGTVHDGAYLAHMPKQPEDKEGVRGDPEWARGFLRYLEGMLERGEMEGHPFEVVPGGLEGVETGLKKLKAGEGAGRKFVYRISE